MIETQACASSNRSSSDRTFQQAAAAQIALQSDGENQLPSLASGHATEFLFNGVSHLCASRHRILELREVE